MIRLIKLVFILALIALLGFFIFKLRFAGDVNIVVLGVDSVEKYSHHSDTIVVMCFKPGKKSFSLLSVPRDTLVDYKGRKCKINTVYALNASKSGHKLASTEVSREIEDVCRIRVDYYIQLDYKAVKEIVDLFNGVNVTIDKKMHYTDKADHLYIDFEPGSQILNGDAAVKYLRFRADKKADIGRIDRQQKFMFSFFEKAKKGLTAAKIPSIYPVVTKYVNTDVPVDKAVFLYKTFKDTDVHEVKRTTLPGEAVKIKGISYWKPDYTKMEEEFVKAGIR
jgi:polyisoprenyl-teichoic acid--peptidoglycan teichoic acid transferase